MRTLEQRLKFDHGLPVGTSLVLFTHGGASRKALVRITARGAVYYLPEPRPEDMYTSWNRAIGDDSRMAGGVIVWAARDPEFMIPFAGDPVATVPV